MPSVEAHLAAAEENVAAYGSIPDNLPGWKAVVLFYTAVHYVEALCAMESLHHREHVHRDLYIKKHHSSIWPAYSRLKTESLKARYLAVGHFAGTGDLKKSQFSMTAAQVDEQLRKKCLPKIRGYVDAAMKKANARSNAPSDEG